MRDSIFLPDGVIFDLRTGAGTGLSPYLYSPSDTTAFNTSVIPPQVRWPPHVNNGRWARYDLFVENPSSPERAPVTRRFQFWFWTSTVNPYTPGGNDGFGGYEMLTDVIDVLYVIVGILLFGIFHKVCLRRVFPWCGLAFAVTAYGQTGETGPNIIEYETRALMADPSMVSGAEYDIAGLIRRDIGDVIGFVGNGVGQQSLRWLTPWPDHMCPAGTKGWEVGDCGCASDPSGCIRHCQSVTQEEQYQGLLMWLLFEGSFPDDETAKEFGRFYPSSGCISIDMYALNQPWEPDGTAVDPRSAVYIGDASEFACQWWNCVSTQDENIVGACGGNAHDCDSGTGGFSCGAEVAVDNFALDCFGAASWSPFNPGQWSGVYCPVEGHRVGQGWAAATDSVNRTEYCEVVTEDSQETTYGVGVYGGLEETLVILRALPGNHCDGQDFTYWSDGAAIDSDHPDEFCSGAEDGVRVRLRLGDVGSWSTSSELIITRLDELASAVHAADEDALKETSEFDDLPDTTVDGLPIPDVGDTVLGAAGTMGTQTLGAAHTTLDEIDHGGVTTLTTRLNEQLWTPGSAPDPSTLPGNPQLVPDPGVFMGPLGTHIWALQSEQMQRLDAEPDISKLSWTIPMPPVAGGSFTLSAVDWLPYVKGHAAFATAYGLVRALTTGMALYFLACASYAQICWGLGLAQVPGGSTAQAGGFCRGE